MSNSFEFEDVLNKIDMTEVDPTEFADIKSLISGRLVLTSLSDVSTEFVMVTRHLFPKLELDFFPVENGCVVMAEAGAIPYSGLARHKSVKLSMFHEWSDIKNHIVRLDDRFLDFSKPEHELFFNCFKLRTVNPDWNERLNGNNCLRETVLSLYNVDVGKVLTILEISQFKMHLIRQEIERYDYAGYQPHVLITAPSENDIPVVDDTKFGHIEPWHDWFENGKKVSVRANDLFRKYPNSMDQDYDTVCSYLAMKFKGIQNEFLTSDRSMNWSCPCQMKGDFFFRQHFSCHFKVPGVFYCPGCHVKCDRVVQPFYLLQITIRFNKSKRFQI